MTTQEASAGDEHGGDPMPKAEALVRVTIAYALALFVGGLVLAFSDSSPLWRALQADVVATLVIYAFSRWHGNSSFYDAYWSVIPPLLMLWWMAVGESGSLLRELAAMAILLYWSVRLTCHWAYYWPGMEHEDWRYPHLKKRSGNLAWLMDLLGIHLFPTIQVFLGLLPVYAMTCLPTAAFNALDVVAIVVGVSAVTLQMMADFQLHAFAAKHPSGTVLRTGLWSVCRHPNYLGEIGLWVSLALFGIAAYPAGFIWIVLGAVAMIVMFVFVSIPLMDERSLERRPGYDAVMAEIPALLPSPWKR